MTTYHHAGRNSKYGTVLCFDLSLLPFLFDELITPCAKSALQLFPDLATVGRASDCDNDE